MKERFISLAVCLFLATGTLFAKSLVMTLKNGAHVYYMLGEETNPILRFIDGKIIVNADEYEFSGIKNFYISATDDPNGIEQTMTNSIVAEYNNSIVTVNTDQSLPIRIYSHNGCEMKVCPQKANGYTIINLSTLSEGIYIITIGDESLKILKR